MTIYEKGQRWFSGDWEVEVDRLTPTQVVCFQCWPAKRTDTPLRFSKDTGRRIGVDESYELRLRPWSAEESDVRRKEKRRVATMNMLRREIMEFNNQRNRLDALSEEDAIMGLQVFRDMLKHLEALGFTGIRRND
jgi:hypothetical protein